MSVMNRLSRWIGRDRLRPDEIDGNRFLKAASLFADTAIEHGRDRYSGKEMPLFADCLHTDHLKAPRSMTSHRTSTEPKPAVWSFFQNQQNLIRLLSSLSQFTGDGKYVHAAGEAAEYMFNNYWYPESGVLHWGGRGYVDLVTGNRYGMKGVVHEIAERIGDNLLQGRQHPDSGLFTLEDDFTLYSKVMDKPELQESHEGKTVIEILQDTHKTANLDAMEPLALLSLYAAQTGRYDIMPGWTAGGLYLKVSSVGHIVSKEMQLWFDKPALKQFYKDSNINCTWSIDED